MSMENLENHAPITKVLEALRAGLSDYALREYEDTYGSEDYIKELKNALMRRKAYSKMFHNKEEAIQVIDPLGWVNICLYSREEVFKDKLGDKEKSYLELLREDRNIWGHQSPENAISNDDAYYTAGTAARLLKAIGAKEEAKGTREIAQELRIYSEREQKNTEKSTPANNNHRSSTDSRLDVEVLQKIEDKEYQMQTPENKHKQSSDSSSNHRFKPDKQTDEEKVESLERTSHADDTIQQQLLRQHQEMMRQMQQTSQPIININPNISPNINPSISANAGDQVAYAPPAPPTVIAERNNAAFVVGVLGGLFGLLGIAHIFNHKVLRGLVYLFIGTVCYWIFLLFLLTALTNIGSSLWIAAVAIHLVIIWQHAKRGASSASANQTKEPKRK